MQKRDFFKSAGASLLAAAVGLDVAAKPASAPATLPQYLADPFLRDDFVPQSVSQLECWFAANFDCFEGRPAAWYYLDRQERETPEDADAQWFARHPRQYYSLFGLDTANTPDAERRLVGTVHAAFSKMRKDLGYQPTLAWRRLPRIEVGVKTEFGPQVATRWDVEDGKFFPHGHAFNALSDTWHEWSKSHSVMRLRMRLALHGHIDEDYSHLVCHGQEGCAFNTI